jgi:hypothetical protein
MCVHGRGAHYFDSDSLARTGRVTDPGRFSNPTPLNSARGVPRTGGKMTTPIVKAIESFDRAHRHRQAVLSKLRRLRQDEPPRVPEALSTQQVVAALRRLQADRLPLVSRDAKRQLGLSPRG